MLLATHEIASYLNAKWHNPNSALTQNIDSTLISTDSRKNLQNSFFFALKGEKFDGHDFLSQAVNNGASAICIAKHRAELANSFSVPVLLVEDTLTAYSQIAQLAREKSSAKIVAITGSCGKTSTKDFLSKILEFNFGSDAVISTISNTNNLIGVPQNLLRLNEKHSFAVIEMGTNHKGEIETLSSCAKPNIAIITCIGRAHIEFLGSIEGIAKEKSSIFKGLKKNGIAIIPAICDFRKILIQEAQNAGAKIFSFSPDENSDSEIYAKCLQTDISGSEIEIILNSGDRQRFFLPVPGKHQISNALAASLCAIKLGVSLQNISSALSNARISGMRMKKTLISGITFINDAYNSNPESAKAGLNWLSEVSSKKDNIFIFIGDMLELGENALKMHTEVLELALAKFISSKIVTVGDLMSDAAKKFKNPKIISFKNSDDAAIFAKSAVKEGHIVYIKGSRGMTMEKIQEIFEE